ncbi:MAG TPA: hypothetical protein VF171_01785 [Trueperaceae bacterium]
MTTSEGGTLIHDPEAAAGAARLRYVSDEEAGYRRRRRGRGFSYHDETGEVITDPNVRARIENLAIPPAWTDVWICRSGNGHIQATGRDEAGRKQYIYHPKWREVRDHAKFGHLIAFGEALPGLRRRVRRDLQKGDLDLRQVTAAVIKLMDATLIRVGNRSYAKTNHSYGLTTLRDKHVHIEGERIELSFTGKAGLEHDISLRNEQLARIVQQCEDIPGYELFQYVGEDGEKHVLDSSDVNLYLAEVSGNGVTAKDFRTWGGTVLAAEHLSDAGQPARQADAKRMLAQAVREVASALGNTPAVCRQSYIHPTILEDYQQGAFGEAYRRSLAAVRHGRPKELRLHEAATLDYLRRTEAGPD